MFSENWIRFGIAGVSVATGALVACAVSKRVYEKRLEQEMAAMRDYYEEKMAALTKSIEAEQDKQDDAAELESDEPVKKVKPSGTPDKAAVEKLYSLVEQMKGPDGDYVHLGYDPVYLGDEELEIRDWEWEAPSFADRNEGPDIFDDYSLPEDDEEDEEEPSFGWMVEHPEEDDDYYYPPELWDYDPSEPPEPIDREYDYDISDPDISRALLSEDEDGTRYFDQYKLDNPPLKAGYIPDGIEIVETHQEYDACEYDTHSGAPDGLEYCTTDGVLIDADNLARRPKDPFLTNTGLSEDEMKERNMDTLYVIDHNNKVKYWVIINNMSSEEL